MELTLSVFLSQAETIQSCSAFWRAGHRRDHYLGRHRRPQRHRLRRFHPLPHPRRSPRAGRRVQLRRAGGHDLHLHRRGPTMFNMVDFSGNTHQALLALIAAMIGSIGWGVFLLVLGHSRRQVPSLIAGVTGGAIAEQAGRCRALSGCSSFTAWCSRWWAASSSAWRPPRSSSFSSPRQPPARQQSVRSAAGHLCLRAVVPPRRPGRAKFMSIGLLGIALAFGMETSGATDFPWAHDHLLGGNVWARCSAASASSSPWPWIWFRWKYQGVAASLSTVITLFVASMTGMPSPPPTAPPPPSWAWAHQRASAA